MNILVVDNDLTTHDELVRCVTEVWPQEKIVPFTDPLLSLKYGINHPLHILIAAARMRGATGQDLARILRQHNPNLRVVYVADAPMCCDSDFEVEPDAVVQWPVTAEKLRKITPSLCLDNVSGTSDTKKRNKKVDL